MMTIDQKRPNKSHQKLPSFNELTSKFSNNLQIDSSTQSATTSPAPNSSNQTPQVPQHVVNNQQKLVNVSAEQAAAAAPNPAQYVPHPSHHPQPHPQQVQQVHQYVQQPQHPPQPMQQHVYVQGQIHQYPPQQHPQQPYGPPQQLLTPIPQAQPQPLQPSQPPQQLPPQQFGRPSIPPRYPSEFTRYQFPKQEPNYVTNKKTIPSDYSSGQNSTPSQPQQQFPPISSNFDHDRRLSMQYPPYPSKHQTHSKKDSYDSQTSLSTLADIASSNDVKKQSEDVKDFVHSVETLIDKFRRITKVFNDVHYDFTSQIEKSMNEPKQDNDRIKLLYEYTSSDGKPMNEISIKYLKNFVSNIPIFALVNTIDDIDYVCSVLRKWLELKQGGDEGGSSHGEDLELTTPTSATSNLSSTSKKLPPTSRPQYSRNHSRQSSRNKFNLQRHQSISGVSSKTINKNPKLVNGESSSGEPYNKKRRSNSSTKLPSSSNSSTSLSTLAGNNNNNNSNNNTKNDSVSLVVNPPKPVMDSNNSQPPPPKGVINEELSIKIDHKCEQCGSDETPEWRRGPHGSRSLCNACGLFYGKLIKKFDYVEAAKIMLKRKNQGNGDDRRIPID